MIEIPVWEKYTLSIEEAAAYFRIGENKLRKIIAENPDADFVLWNGTRSQIKRKKFEEYIDKLNVIQIGVFWMESVRVAVENLELNRLS